MLKQKTKRKQELTKIKEGNCNIFDWICGFFILAVGGFSIIFTIVTLAIKLA